MTWKNVSLKKNAASVNARELTSDKDFGMLNINNKNNPGLHRTLIDVINHHV